MIMQIGTLKESLRKAVQKLHYSEDKLRNRDSSVVKLTGLKEKLQVKVSRTWESERATEFGY